MKTHSSNRLIAGTVALALSVASVICVVTAVRIEHLNYLAGDAIQWKAEQEPNAKWRIGLSSLIAYQRVQTEWRKEKGLSPDAELSANDREAISARLKAMELSPSPSDRLGMVLGSWGLVQYPLAAILLFGSLVASANRTITGVIPKGAFYFQALIGALALGLALYRGYFTSLGW